MRGRNFKEAIYKARISQRRIWRTIWPIRWEVLRDLPTLWKSIRFADYFAKLCLTVSIIAVFISTFFVYTTLYAVTSYKVAAQNGYLQEGILGLNRTDINVFNPLLTSNSDNEKRITTLLYHPLYLVNLPDFSSENTKINLEPVLLAKSPEWSDKDNADPNTRFKRLRMQLKSDIFWSDGKPITTDDVKVTFDKLKEKDANSEFNSTFKEINLEIIAGLANTFELVAPRPSPQLLYTSNFSPVQRDTFFNQSIDQISKDNYSKAPTVTSGYYRFAPTDQNGTVADPRSNSGERRTNPFNDPKTGVLQSIFLQRNPKQNFAGHSPYLEYYIFQRFPNFTSLPNSDPQASNFEQSSLEESFKASQTQFFTRSTTTGLDAALTSERVRSVLNSEQKIVNSNTFYTLFFKSQKAPDPVRIKSLRRYLACQLANSDLYTKLDPDAQANLVPVSKSRMFVPPQLQTGKEVDCTGDLVGTLTKDGKIFTTREDATSKLKKVYFTRRQVSVNIIAAAQDRKIALKVQEVLINAGLIVDILDRDQASKLADTASLMYLYPVTAASPDIYSLYSRKGQNLAGAVNTTELTDLEAYLAELQTTNFSPESRVKLANFFTENYLSLTLFQGKQEYDFSTRVFGVRDSLPTFNGVPFDYYINMPRWHVEQKTKSKLFDR